MNRNGKKQPGSINGEKRSILSEKNRRRYWIEQKHDHRTKVQQGRRNSIRNIRNPL
ncbi:hypothetical protein D3C73_1646800 [compost metagenome]